MTLKDLTVSGLMWSTIESVGLRGITFLFGIILARLLTPEEYGLIGMMTIFIAVSQTFVNSGFSQALIRKKNCTDSDYSTVFYFNIVVALFFYFVLFFFAPTISRFFSEPQLIELLRVLGIILVINAFSLIQTVTLTKRIDFKLLTKISMISSIASGVIAIMLAYKGFGVWSLVIRAITLGVFKSILLWVWNSWRPKYIFCMTSFKELFSFGSKLMISGLLDTFYKNFYYFIIGKYYSATELGYYSRAKQFSALPSQNLQQIIRRVTYPVLATMQHDPERLKRSFRTTIRSTAFLCFVIMLLMAAVAEPMVLSLIGEQWQPCVVYLRLLCFIGMLYPLHAMNLNMLLVQGRSGLILKIEILKKVLMIPVIYLGISIGIKPMLWGMLGTSLVCYYINSYWSGKFIGYSFWDQLKDILPSFSVSGFMAIIVYTIGTIMNTEPIITFGSQVIIGLTLIIVFSEFIKLHDYMYIKSLIVDKFSSMRKSCK